MNELNFINRNKDITFLKREYESLVSNKVLILESVSGVGKSELTKKFLIGLSDVISLKIDIKQHGRKSYEDGYFLQRIGESLDELSQQYSEVNSILDFQKSFKSSIINNRIINLAKNEVLHLVPGGKTIQEIADKTFGLGDYSKKNLFNSLKSENIIMVKDYIIQEFKTKQIVLNIENIQSIDDYSLDLLSEILQNCKQTFFILEFTRNDSEGYSYDFLLNFFEKSCRNITSYSLEPLQSVDLQRIIKQNPIISWELIKNSYTNWDGNLRPLVDIFARLKYNQNKPTNSSNKISLINGTSSHINSLSKSELFLLIIIIIHNEPVEKNLLKHLLTFSSTLSYIIDIEIILKSLNDRLLIKINNHLVEIYHDSITESIKANPNFTLFQQIGIKFWYFVYDEIIENGDIFISKSVKLQRILYFSTLLNNDEKIFSLLDEIARYAISSRSPERLIEYVLNIRTRLLEEKFHLEKKQLKKIELWVIELYHRIGHATSALNIIKSSQFSDNKFTILAAILNEEIGNQYKAIEICNSNLRICRDQKSNYAFALNLVKLASFAGIGKNKEKMKLFGRLYNDGTFKTMYEYGFLLRNSELLYSSQDALPYLKKSIQIFEKFHSPRQVAFSRNSYAFHLARIGFLTKAKAELKIAEEILCLESSERHTIFNNYAAIMLYEHRIDEEVEAMLRHAKLSADMDFDLLTIHSNLLILADKRKEDEKAKQIIKIITKILLKPTFSNKEIIRQVYFNIVQFHKTRSNTRQMNQYYNKIDDLNLYNSPLWNYWLYNGKKPEGLDSFQANYNHSIAFLSHWHIDFDSNLMNY
jgi:hypothetical protein